MPPPVIGIMGLGLGIIGTAGGMIGSSEAAAQSKAAYRASLEEKQRAYGFNIGQTEQEIGGIKYAGQERRSDIRREGDQFLRGQAAAIGASGAVIGVGSPLMTMTETAEGIELDLLRTRRLEQMEVEKRESSIEFMESEIEEIGDLLEKKRTKPPEMGKSRAGPHRK